MSSLPPAPARSFRPATWQAWDDFDPFWREAFLEGPYQGNPEAFARRLSWSTTPLRQPLTRQDQEEAWPKWWQEIDWSARLPSTISGPIQEIPFAPCLEPIAAHAIKDFPAALQPGLATSLLHELSNWSHRSLYAAFDTFRRQRQENSASGDHFAAFLADWLTGNSSHLAHQMPGLIRLLGLLCIQWRENLLLCLNRLTRDHPQAIPSSILSSGADRHQGGAKVLIIVLSDGRKLAYKPRSVQAEALFHDWLSSSTLLPPDKTPPPLAVHPRSDNTGDYGWMEFVECATHLTPDSARRYHDRAGALLFFMHLLGASDLHMENVIASPEGPVVIDLECLLQPKCATVNTAAAPADLPGTTGLLPTRTRDPAGGWVDISGYGGCGGYRSPVGKRRYLCLHRGLMNWKVEAAYEPASHNQPGIAPWDYLAEICQGYAAAHAAALQAPASVLALMDELAKVRLRWLRRPTTEYGAVIRQLVEAPCLTHIRHHAASCETLATAWTQSSVRPAAWPVLDLELPDLDQYDIPVFHTLGHSTALWKDGHSVVPDYFSETGHAAALRRLKSLGPSFLAAALEEVAIRLTPPPTAPAITSDNRNWHTLPLKSLMVETTSEMAAAVLARMVTIHGRNRWPETATSAHDPAGISLYGGTLGTAVFLAAVGLITEDVACLATAKRLGHEAIHAQATTPVQSLGALVGAGSVVLGLATLAFLTSDATFQEAAVKCALHISPAHLEADRELDWLGGLAGWTGSLAELYQHTPSPALRAALEAALTELQHRQIQGQWKGPDGQPLAGGLAHGAAGVALAISRAATVLGYKEQASLVKQMIENEAAGFDSALGNWPLRHAVHGRRVGMNAYCNGAAGMLAAATEINHHQGFPSLTSAPWPAALHTFLHAAPSGCDHICCGNAGRLAMAQAVRVAPTLLHDPARRLGLLWKKHHNMGLDEGAPSAHAGLFRGLSGIGWVLLRVAFPHQLPDLLLLKTRPESSPP